MNDNVLDNTTRSSEIPSQAISSLNKASGWVKAVAILGFIGAGFVVLGGIGMMLTIPLIGLFYLVIAGAYILLSSLLLKQANSIQGATPDLDKFALNYLNFWKISVIIMIVMFALSLITGLVVGAAGSRLF